VDIGAFEFVHPAADTDRDTQCDQDELVAGVSPLDPSEWFRIEEAGSTHATAETRIAWHSVTGRTYAVHTLPPDALSWDGHVVLATNIAGTGGLLDWAGPWTGDARRFYRIAVRDDRAP